MLVSDIIYTAQRLGGVLQLAGRTASTYESADALSALNGMLDSWRTERLMVYSIDRRVFPFGASQEIYTIGQDGDFNATRPARIERAGVLLASSGLELPLRIIEDDQYAEVRLKTLPSTFPTALYEDRGFPLDGLHFWPIPTDTSNSAVLYVWNTLSSFAAITDAISLPDGYQEAITYNLALRLAALHPRANVSPLIVETARQAKAAVKRLNIPDPLIDCDSALMSVSAKGRFNILTGDFKR